jgi:multicomponent Na+:H+ antiporter subunit C
VDGETPIFINPMPSVLILTGIVVSVSITVYALSLVIRIYQTYQTIDQEEIVAIQNKEQTYD